MSDDSLPPSEQSAGVTDEMADAAAIQDLPLDDFLQQMSVQPDAGFPDQTGYDPRSETYHAQHDWADSQSLSTTIIEAVGAATDTDPNQMEPMYEALDPDALDALFRPRSDDSLRTNGQVLFSLDGHDVAVHSCGDIIVDVSENERGERERENPGRE
ncbi:HalOD1 output domain-containing protein [Natrinema sp. 74]|uniref:HalOD1 output domain-containing protein n=1 Tax=Natrinema sp. 74 TaxID=3384159 RepID=UPI0038D4C628